jgi:hypothetical protein
MFGSTSPSLFAILDGFQAAKLTQRKESTFNHQTATRLTEFHVLSCAMAEILEDRKVWEYFSFWEKEIDARIPRVPVPETAEEDFNLDGLDSEFDNLHTDAEAAVEDVEAEVAEPADEETLLIRTGGTRIKVYYDEDEEGAPPSFDVLGRGIHRKKTTWMTDVVSFLCELQEAMDDPLDGDDLEICTEHHRGNHVFYGHPNFRGEGPWKDWALVDWGPEGVLPCHIWCFVVCPEMPTGGNAIEFGGIRLKKGVFAVTEVAEYVEVDEDEEHKSDLFTPLELITEGLDANDGEVVRRRFYLADTDAIVGPCCVIPDIGGATNAYFQVKNRSQWVKEFITWLEARHTDDDMEDSDDEN